RENFKSRKVVAKAAEGLGNLTLVAGPLFVGHGGDLGQGPRKNPGIRQGHRTGLSTSASMMVRWPDAAEAAAYGAEHPELSLGLHIDLGEWAYRDETWVPLYEVVALDETEAITDEITQQLARFRGLVGKDPSHVDSHQHVHL